MAKGQQSRQTKEQRKGKIFQPKYPSTKAQCKPSQEVLVPKHQLGSRHLCQGDEYKWVERQATNKKCSSGWVSSQWSLEEQGYSEGNQLLWLPKPKFLAQKMPSNPSTTNIAQNPNQHKKRKPKKGKRKSKFSKASHKGTGLCLPSEKARASSKCGYQRQL